MKTISACLIAAGLLAIPLSAQPPEGYLDIDMIKVKMGKRMDFDAINKRMVEMNRKKGDHWTVYEVVYGDSSVVCIVEARATHAAAEAGTNAFNGAVTNAVGEVGMHKLFNDWDATVEAEHETLYRRRWDLSSNAPADAAAESKLLGQARWIRVITNVTRPGKALVYEAEVRKNKEAQQRVNPGVPFLVSQVAAGGSQGTYRSTNLLKSLGDLDTVKPISQVRGDSYAGYMKTIEESVESTDIMIGRYVPELSNPPDDVVAIDPAFWRPKPAPAVTKAKPAAKQ